ncbi:probable arabinosyltransferase ARAD1 [Tanacetum coccineum]
MDSRECSGVLIVCIGNEETAQRANNDLNVLYDSPLFDDELADTAPECPFVVNGHTYRKCYYLANGIYPAWFTFVKSFSVARDEKSLKFKIVQEAARKDIERAFGVLQGKFKKNKAKTKKDYVFSYVKMRPMFLSKTGSFNSYRFGAVPCLLKNATQTSDRP